MSQYLDEELLEYSRSDYYPFHMPGHKRQKLGDFRPEEVDITEIEGFDNLHHAEGILKEGQERLARLFGADESFYLVNGSTAGLLSAICGCIRKGDRILIGRNCHKAVYHAAYLMEAKVEYLYPEPTGFGIQGSIAPEQVKQKLEEYPDTRAVVVTSPTYDGIVSDIRTIADIVHGYGIPLIVDEAHGAHFGFSEGFPQKAIALGADLCVESLHKTLPSYTQTAVLHMARQRNRLLSGETGKALTHVTMQGGAPGKKENEKAAGLPGEYWFDSARVKRYLGIFQSSSPSYVLMAGMDRCVRMVKEDVKRYAGADTREESLFAQFEGRLRRFYGACEKFRFVEVFPYVPVCGDTCVNIKRRREGQNDCDSACCTVMSGESGQDVFEEEFAKAGADDLERKCVGNTGGVFARDNSKILISAEAAGLHGQQLYDLLLEKYHLQMEMASGHYVTALTSIMDTEEGFRRLYEALQEIEREAFSCAEMDGSGSSAMGEPEESSGKRAGESADFLTPVRLYRSREKRMELADAMDADREAVPLAESDGKISGDFVWLYPPGIPILVPGEVITSEVLEILALCRARHMQVQGMQDPGGERVQVIAG
ncbi:MAG: aminotransferase class V-fold PLP-dependent enzyme [Clostridiales bacterium]|nr:aminotransferase class V-fold PLP-dependent enzyme [Clostridiales bacterium]